MIPVYGELVSFGTYYFDPLHGNIIDFQRKRARKYANVLGKANPVDYHGGGVVPWASSEVTFVYWIVAPEGTAMEDCAQYVEETYSAIDALSTTLNGDGTTGERQTLTVKLRDGTVMWAEAALVAAPIVENNREFAYLTVDLIFGLFEEFHT